MRLAVLSAMAVLLMPIKAQVSGPRAAGGTSATHAVKTEQRPLKKHRRQDAIGERKNSRTLEPPDAGRRHNSGEFRKLMQEEMKLLPALNKPMERFFVIQTERYELQQKRQKVAGNSSEGREDILKQFHSLLQRDLQLSDEARTIAHKIVEDMPRITSQLHQRRAQLNARIDGGETTATEVGASDPGEKELLRRLRYIELLEKKLQDLTMHPERLDLLARVMRGLPPEEGSNFSDRPARELKVKDTSTTVTTLIELQNRRKDLQRELRQVEKRIDEQRRNAARKKGGGGASGPPGL